MFETFIKESITSFELDHALYLSPPVCIWDGMLKITDINLKLISDIEMYQFVGSTIRGYAEVSSKFLKSYYASKVILYIM